MKTIILISILLSIVVLLVPGVTGLHAENSEAVFIANMSVTETSISANDVKLLFLGKKVKWADGQWVRLATFLDSSAHEELLTQFVHKTPINFKVYWRRAIMTGTGLPPKQFDSDADIIKYVARTKGAIGYVSSIPSDEGVRVVEVRDQDIK